MAVSGRRRTCPAGAPWPAWPLLPRRASHCFAAFGYGFLNDARPFPGQEGVLFDETTRCDVFFITLKNKKSERLFSPTTRTDDYDISPLEFHWKCQSLTREASSKGQR